MHSRLSPDALLQDYMGSFIATRKVRHAWGRARRKWQPGEKLRLIFAGYNGARNTGGDVRVEEMIRQIRHLLGDKNCELSVLTIDPELTQDYFSNAKQIQIPNIFPHFLYETIAQQDGVLACEGSMFKSKFADALSTMMAGALGLANAENKLSVGYGAEAGDMSPTLKRNVQRWCKQSLIICRNKESQGLLSEMNIRNSFGADTAWTYAPKSSTKAKKILKAKGWDGKKDILAICPINPFWWPVRPNITRSLQNYFSKKQDPLHYRSVYFHEYDAESRQKYEAYISALAAASETFCKENNVHPVLIAMEKLDTLACRDLAEKLSVETGTVSSLEHPMDEMISVLWQAQFMVSSRFHAIVTSMPGGVASCGVTMDERIQNLMKDRGHTQFVTHVENESLEEKTLEMLRGLKKNRNQIELETYKNIPQQLKRMSLMGEAFLKELSSVYPEFPISKKFGSWESYLPRLPKHLTQMLEKHT